MFGGTTARIEFPTLAPGVTLLDIDSDLGVEPLCALVLDRLLHVDGQGLWVDAGGHVQTRTLQQLAPHPRYLDRLTVARGFTAFQHASLLDRLPAIVDDKSEAAESPAVVVAPAVDLLYREDDVPRDQAHDLLVRRLATLAGIARDHDVPVLVTRVRDDELAAPLEAAARKILHCRETPFGPRFTSDEGSAETMVYRLDDGWVQTTLAFWREILTHRASAAGEPVADAPTTEPASPATPVTPEGW